MDRLAARDAGDLGSRRTILHLRHYGGVSVEGCVGGHAALCITRNILWLAHHCSSFAWIEVTTDLTRSVGFTAPI